MSQLVQRYRNVAGESENNWPDDTFGNIIINNATTSKISIMAPPGTVVQLTAADLPEKKILIGASGIYDFDNENIQINSISFPEAENQAEEINILQSYLRKASSQIITLSDSSTEDDYKSFCSAIQNLIFPGTRPDDQSADMTLGDMTATYLATISNQVRGNTAAQLHDIVVNYITND